MQGVYGFNFEQVELKRFVRDKYKNCVWIDGTNRYINISKDIIEKTAFMHLDEIILLADKKMGVFCIAPSPNKQLAGFARIARKGSNTRITSKDMVSKIKLICNQIGYNGTVFDAWVGFDGSILFKPKEE